MMGQAARAETTLHRAIAAYDSVTPPTQEELVRVKVDLAQSLRDQGRPTEAEPLLRGALRELGSPDSPLATDISARLGYILFLEGRYDEATAILRLALRRERQIFGPFHQATLLAMRSLASTLRGPQSLAEAESLDREALATAQTLYGEDHLETYWTRMALAVLLERKGDFAEATETVRAGLDKTARLFGETSLQTALTLRTLGSVELAVGRSDNAEVVLRRAIDEFHRAAPEGNLDEGDALNRLAYVTTRRSSSDASEIYARAVAFDGTRVPTDPPFVTDGYEYLGLAALQRRDLDVAERLLRRAVRLYDVELPNGHLYRAQSHAALGQTLMALGHTDDGRRELTIALQQWAAARPARPERVAEVRAALSAR